MSTVTKTAKCAIDYLDRYASGRRGKPFRLAPKDFALDIDSTPQLVGMAQADIVNELELRGHKVAYKKENNKRFFLFG